MGATRGPTRLVGRTPRAGAWWLRAGQPAPWKDVSEVGAGTRRATADSWGRHRVLSHR
jgi:hypothetical protein